MALGVNATYPRDSRLWRGCPPRVHEVLHTRPARSSAACYPEAGAVLLRTLARCPAHTRRMSDALPQPRTGEPAAIASGDDVFDPEAPLPGPPDPWQPSAMPS